MTCKLCKTSTRPTQISAMLLHLAAMGVGWRRPDTASRGDRLAQFCPNGFSLSSAAGLANVTGQRLTSSLTSPGAYRCVSGLQS